MLRRRSCAQPAGSIDTTELPFVPPDRAEDVLTGERCCREELLLRQLTGADLFPDRSTASDGLCAYGCALYDPDEPQGVSAFTDQ